MGKRISIIMPCYNAEKYIADSLDSIIMQNYQNYEIIVVDGGSKDKTLEILNSYKSHIDVLIVESDNGPHEALNKGFSVATGSVYCWLNSDDVYLSENVLSHVDKAFGMHDIGFVYGHHLILDQSGLVKKSLYTWMPKKIKNIAPGNVFTGSVFFASKCWADFKGFDKNINVAFEYELWDYLVSNYEAIMINCFMAGFRVYPGTISSTRDDEMLSQIIKIRGGKYYNDKGRLVCLFDRLKSLYENKLLLEVISNSLKDKYSGMNWREINKYTKCKGILGKGIREFF